MLTTLLLTTLAGAAALAPRQAESMLGANGNVTYPVRAAPWDDAPANCTAECAPYLRALREGGACVASVSLGADGNEIPVFATEGSANATGGGASANGTQGGACNYFTQRNEVFCKSAGVMAECTICSGGPGPGAEGYAQGMVMQLMECRSRGYELPDSVPGIDVQTLTPLDSATGSNATSPSGTPGAEGSGSPSAQFSAQTSGQAPSAQTSAQTTGGATPSGQSSALRAAPGLAAVIGAVLAAATL